MKNKDVKVPSKAHAGQQLSRAEQKNIKGGFPNRCWNNNRGYIVCYDNGDISYYDRCCDSMEDAQAFCNGLAYTCRFNEVILE